MNPEESDHLPDGVALARAPNPSPMTGQGTNTYVLADHAESLVIDPGPRIESHLVAVAARARDAGRLRAILITHGHPDHGEGASRLRALTGAPILAHSHAGVPEVDAVLADGATIRFGARRLIALHTPGHRFDHLCFLLPDARVLFAGDLVAGTGTVVIAPPEGDLTGYLASLQRLLALDLAQILPGHGPSIREPGALLAAYIRHRNEREAQVLDGLDQGLRSLDALVAHIYAGVDPALLSMAALTLTAHLQKLEREGRIARSEDTGRTQWHRIPPDGSPT